MDRRNFFKSLGAGSAAVAVSNAGTGNKACGLKYTSVRKEFKYSDDMIVGYGLFGQKAHLL